MNAQSPLRGSQLVRPRLSLSQKMLSRIFEPIVERYDDGLEQGTIEALLPDGSFRILGNRSPGPLGAITIIRWRALWRIATGGSVGMYEAWADGDWSSPDPVPLFELVMRNRRTLGATARSAGPAKWMNSLRHWLRRNTRENAKRNILAHYDLGNDFYRHWLDFTMSYSSAVFAEPFSNREALVDAQRTKMKELYKRIVNGKSQSILEIGCGWGYFSRLCAASKSNHRVTAISLSPSQLRWARGEALKDAHQPDYRLCDYRDIDGLYDSVVSCEMVEAVGQQYWPEFLDTINRVLKPSGKAAIQFISIADDVFDAYSSGVDFIQTYIFPGGMLLSESRFKALARARGLRWENPVHFGLHYAETLRRWRVRFDLAVEEGRLPSGFDEKFVKLWRFYLQYCEGGFRGGGINVAQVTLVKAG